MARVSISVNSFVYDIACPDGEEQHIMDLAGILDAKVGELVGAIGQAGEARLLAMAGLLMADELKDTTNSSADEVADLRAQLSQLTANAAATAQVSSSDPDGKDAQQQAERLEQLAAQIETIAERMENP